MFYAGLLTTVVAVAIVCNGRSAAAAPAWSACPLAERTSGAPFSRIEVQAATSGCSLWFLSATSATYAAGTDKGNTAQLASSPTVAGVYNGSLGAILLLQDILLVDAVLNSPQGNPNKVLLPAALDLPPGAQLKLRDMFIMVTGEQLTDYIAFMLGVPQAPVFTDNTTFLHIVNYTSYPFGVVEARAVTLIAQEEASLSGQRVALLQFLPTAGNPAAAAARGDAAGVVTVTDSYVLGATNTTILPLMQQLAMMQPTNMPLFVNIASNLTLFPAAWGAAWPPGGLKIGRPAIWFGSSWRPASIDFGMEAGQIVLQGQHASVTLLNLVLENLGYGNEASVEDAEGNSVQLSNQLWAFKYKRSEPRLVLRNVVQVLPSDQVENIIYWVNAFNSDLEFWRQQTSFLRDRLKYTVIQYTRGKVPGDYIIIKALKKDQQMYNITYTPTPVVAPPLPRVLDPSLAAAQGSKQETTIGAITSVQDLVVTLWNQRQSGCARPHVLLPTAAALPGAASANASTGGGGVLSFAPQPLNVTFLTAATGNAPAPAAAAVAEPPQGLAPNTTLLEPLPAAQGIAQDSSTGQLKAVGQDAAASIPASWPPPGGEEISCPVEIRGRMGPNLTSISFGFARDLFSLPQQQQQQQSLPGRTGQAGDTLLEFSRLRLYALPQGPGLSTSSIGGSSSGSEEPFIIQTNPNGSSTAGNSAFYSQLPAAAWTHLLWAIRRDVTAPAKLSIVNVTLALPAAEAQALYDAAAAAVAVAQKVTIGYGWASFSMVYDTAVIVLVTVLPVAAAVAAAVICVRRRRAAAKKASLSAGALSKSALDAAEVGEGSAMIDADFGPAGAAAPHKDVALNKDVTFSPITANFDDGAAGTPSGAAQPAADAEAAESSITVDLGDQLGQLAALHRRRMGLHAATDSEDYEEPGTTAGGTSRQQQQQVLHNQSLQTAQRLHQSITSVSSNMLLRRVVRSSSATSLPSKPMPPGSPAPQGQASTANAAAAHATSSGRPAAAASTSAGGGDEGVTSRGSAAWPQQQPPRQTQRLSLEEPVRQLSLDEPMAAGCPSSMQLGAEAAAQWHVEDLPPNVLVQQAPERLPNSIRSAGSALRQRQQQQALDVQARSLSMQSRSFRAGTKQQEACVAAAASGAALSKQLQLHETIGSGTFGVVYRATWRGIAAAVKVMTLPGLPEGRQGGRQSRREQMAVMEAALGSALSHPNIVQVYTYLLRPLTIPGFSLDEQQQQPRTSSGGSSPGTPLATSVPAAGSSGQRKGSNTSSSSAAVVGYELQLVMEYCALGSLRAAIDSCLLEDRLTGRPHYLTVLTLALGVARAMHHLHSEGIVHGDLKAGNVLLRLEAVPGQAAAGGSGMSYQEALVAKVADFGLATRLEDQDTHVSGVHRGLKKGFFIGCATLIYRQQIAEECWAHEPQDRPPFEQICERLEQLLEQEQQRVAKLQALVSQRASAPAAVDSTASPQPAPASNAAAPSTSSADHVSAAGRAGGVRAADVLLGATPAPAAPTAAPQHMAAIQEIEAADDPAAAGLSSAVLFQGSPPAGPQPQAAAHPGEQLLPRVPTLLLVGWQGLQGLQGPGCPARQEHRIHRRCRPLSVDSWPASDMTEVAGCECRLVTLLPE
eukprot:gene6912-7128_t